MLHRVKGNTFRALLLNVDLLRFGGALFAGNQDCVLAAGSLREFPKREAGVVLLDLRNNVHAGCVLYLSLPDMSRVPGGRRSRQTSGTQQQG